MNLKNKLTPNNKPADKPEGASMENNEKATMMRDRILSTFMEHAKVEGIRAVSTDQMAKYLSISKKTLYKHFRSKEEIVGAMLAIWQDRVKEPVFIKVGENPREVIRRSVEEWYDNDKEFCPTFWEELGEDYPALGKHYFHTMFERSNRIGKQLRQFRKPTLSEGLVREAYMLLMMRSSEKSFYEAAQLERKQSVLSCLEVWIDGCLDLPDAYTEAHREREADFMY